MNEKLTDKQKRFVDEYLIDLNATQAAIRAGYSKKTANRIATENLSKPVIKEHIQQRMSDRQERTEITQDMVLQRWWDIANADPNDVIHVRRVCCRHCFGIEHQYQWRDIEEYTRAVQIAILAAKEQNKKPDIPLDSGGYGFDRLLRPHPKCPYCNGEGISETHVEDTRHLNSKSKLLYAGVKQTQAGIEIKLRDQDKALENIARHLGMFKDKVELSGQLENTNVNINLTPEERKTRIAELLQKRRV